MVERKGGLLLHAITGSLIIILFLLVLLGTNDASGLDMGGTDDHIAIQVRSGGGGNHSWNDVYGFKLTEDDVLVDEPFNITICRSVKYHSNDSGYVPSGFILGELIGVHWEDEPEPVITIAPHDFRDWAEGLNLTVYVLGEYLRKEPKEDELRQVYSEIRIVRPNHAPVPVAMVTPSDPNDNGSWEETTVVDDSLDDEIVYYIDAEGIHMKIFLNGSLSQDEDGDTIISYWWDLDGDGLFGYEARERKMNTSLYLGEGDHILSLRVSDGHEFSDPPLTIRILIRQPVRFPDLTVQDIQVVNMNGEKEIEKRDRCVIIAEVKNIGDNESVADFYVHFQYWYRDANPEPEWVDLGTVRETDAIDVNGLKLVEIDWETRDRDFIPGEYSFKAMVDWNEDVKELREGNNEFPAPWDEADTEIVRLHPGHPPHSYLYITSVTISNPFPFVNEMVWINVTVVNTGDSDANWVDLHYSINGEMQFFMTYDVVPAGGEGETMTYTFSEHLEGLYAISFTVHDDGNQVDESEDHIIIVWKSLTPPFTMDYYSVDGIEIDVPSGEETHIDFTIKGGGYGHVPAQLHADIDGSRTYWVEFTGHERITPPSTFLMDAGNDTSWEMVIRVPDDARGRHTMNVYITSTDGTLISPEYEIVLEIDGKGGGSGDEGTGIAVILLAGMGVMLLTIIGMILHASLVSKR